MGGWDFVAPISQSRAHLNGCALLVVRGRHLTIIIKINRHGEAR